jgi:uncharacterized membrane protein
MHSTGELRNAPTNALGRLAALLEQSGSLDAPAGAVAGLVDRLLPRGPVRDVLSGKPIGHPAHPMAVMLPIGSWISASLLDLTGGNAKAAQRLVGLGTVAALPALATGSNDLLATTGPQRRVALAHALLNDVALGCYVASWRARRRGSRLRGTALALAGMGTISVSGWLGGHLTYAMGAGQTATAPSTDTPGDQQVRELRPAGNG